MEILQRMGLERGMLDGKVAVITGGARGIGKATARCLSWLGAKIVIGDILEELGAETTKEINESGGDALFVHIDVAIEEDVDRLVNEANRKYGKVDILVNCAVEVVVAPFLEASVQEMDREYAVALRGAVMAAQRVIPGMLERKYGVVVTMTSIEGMAYMSRYSAYKMGIKSMSLSVGKEIPSDAGISFFSMVPGVVDTPLIRQMASGLAKYIGLTPDEVLEQIAKNPGYDGLIPVEHSGAALAYMILHAREFHGQYVEGYLPLSQTGIIKLDEAAATTEEEMSLYEKYKIFNFKIDMSEMVELNQTLETRIKERTRQLEERTKELKEVNTKIMDSINYARVIQQSILPRETKLNVLKEHFVIWKSKDVVGGDIYLFEQFGDNYLIGVIDCTGHGVPGALMTMTANSVLNRIIGEICHDNPAKMLKELNRIIRTTLNQNIAEDGEFRLSDDGMDVALCYVMPKENKLVYSGAKIPLFVNKNNEISMIKGDNQSIGYKKSDEDFEYTNHEITLQGDEVFYITSDGYIDQSGGDKDLPLGKKNFMNILSEVSNKTLSEQKVILEKELKQYQSDNSQRDDITVIGFRI